jgi:hypothetical protein
MKRVLIVFCTISLTLLVITSDSFSKAANQYRNIQMTINQKTAYVDGKTVELEAPPTIINNKTVVPLRFLQENAMQSCSKITWKPEEKKITMQIPAEYLDCDALSSLYRDLENLKLENEQLKEENERLKKNITTPEDVVPPIVYGPKNGIKFTLKSIVKEKESIRIDVIVENLSNYWCRFPASRTTMNHNNKDYQSTGWDSAFSERINAGQRIAGYIRFPLIPVTGNAKFTFVMWPQDTLKNFDFNIKIDLEQAIPASKNSLNQLLE